MHINSLKGESIHQVINRDDISTEQWIQGITNTIRRIGFQGELKYKQNGIPIPPSYQEIQDDKQNQELEKSIKEGEEDRKNALAIYRFENGELRLVSKRRQEVEE